MLAALKTVSGKHSIHKFYAFNVHHALRIFQFRDHMP